MLVFAAKQQCFGSVHSQIHCHLLSFHWQLKAIRNDSSLYMSTTVRVQKQCLSLTPLQEFLLQHQISRLNWSIFLKAAQSDMIISE